MATILLDTSVIFDHLNGRSGRTAYLTQLLDEGYSFGCCPVYLTEVYAGLRSGEEVRTRAFLDDLYGYPGTREISGQAGLLRRDWREKGQTLSYSDVIIVAVALGC